MTPDSRLLDGLSYERAELYGKPSVGCRYTRFDVHSHRLDRMARCCICGRMATNSHHWPAIGYSRQFTLRTDIGQFVLLPALFAVCGSGTDGCHGDWHRGLIGVEWAWDSEKLQESWWDGSMLSKRAPGEWLFEFGFYRFTDKRNGKSWDFRRAKL